APDRRQKVRDAVELAEYNGLPKYFELLRRGFRVAPVSNTDAHASVRAQLGSEFQAQNPDGSWVLPYIDEPGVPREKIQGFDTAQGRAGVVLPPGTPWNYENFLTALRNRSVFRTALPPASGFFMANGRPMGSEFALSPTERRLDFTVWGTTKDGTGGGNQWTVLQVWSPFQPDAPIKEITYEDEHLINLKEVFSLTPYESIYVVTLRQNWENADVVMAPIWVTNPISKPILSLPVSVVTRGSQHPFLSISGGGDTLLLQRATEQAPNSWQTVATITNNYLYPIDHRSQRRVSHWRVVDAYQQTVVSNPVTLTVTDVIDVDTPSLPTPILDGVNVTIHWTFPTPLNVDYYASRDDGLTWTKVGEDSSWAYTNRSWNFYTGGWGNSNVMIRVVEQGGAGSVGVTAPFFVAPAVEYLIPVSFTHASINPSTAYKATDADPGTCWYTNNGNEQLVYVDLGQVHLVKRMELLFGASNPPSWSLGISANQSTYTTTDSGTLTYAANQALVRDYRLQPGGGLSTRYLRFSLSGTFPGVTTQSQICNLRFYR
ncbi:hypothetical protein HUA74_19840, partial [Myxococcus sp. CA051A]